MTPLVAAIPSGGVVDGVHYLLPLPPGITPDALDLFGFWTYEVRVGHSQQWSTAQGRFGRPLRVAGIQHPPPRLTCTPWRNQSGIAVSAPYATTLLASQPALDVNVGDPQTALWFMLYAQVMQTDGATRRNVLLARRLGALLPEDGSLKPNGSPRGQNREPRGAATFVDDNIAAVLRLLGLPPSSPLSVLCVEVLPGPAHTRDQPPAEDPLGTELGQRRVLRTSPLTAVPAIC